MCWLILECTAGIVPYYLLIGNMYHGKIGKIGHMLFFYMTRLLVARYQKNQARRSKNLGPSTRVPNEQGSTVPVGTWALVSKNY
jgi:hypothetical protein